VQQQWEAAGGVQVLHDARGDVRDGADVEDYTFRSQAGEECRVLHRSYAVGDAPHAEDVKGGAYAGRVGKFACVRGGDQPDVTGATAKAPANGSESTGLRPRQARRRPPRFCPTGREPCGLDGLGRIGVTRGRTPRRRSRCPAGQPFGGLRRSPRPARRARHADRPRGSGGPGSLPLQDRGLLVAAYWRTNLTLRQLAPPFGVSNTAGRQACRRSITGQPFSPPLARLTNACPVMTQLVAHTRALAEHM
jgi:hypothetical protein